MVTGNLSGLNLSAAGLLLSVGVLVLIYERACLNSLVGYFYPSVAAQAGGAQRKGASRHAFTPANRFSAQ